MNSYVKCSNMFSFLFRVGSALGRYVKLEVNVSPITLVQNPITCVKIIVFDAFIYTISISCVMNPQHALYQNLRFLTQNRMDPT